MRRGVTPGSGSSARWVTDRAPGDARTTRIEATVCRLVKRALDAVGTAVVGLEEQFLLAQLPSNVAHRLHLGLNDQHVVTARELARVAELRDAG